MIGREPSWNRLHDKSQAVPTRLTELVLRLRAQHHSATALLLRIEPAIADELRAYAAHRHVDLVDLAADCLEQLANGVADAIWQLGIERHGNVSDDPEAALLGSVLRAAIHSRLQGERLVSSEVVVETVHFGFSRSGHPYMMA